MARLCLFAAVVGGVAAASIAAIRWFAPYQVSGDGTLHDSGFWSYPRYTVSFPGIVLQPGAGRYTFNVKGLPPAPMTFGLTLLDQAGRPTGLAGLSGGTEIGVRVSGEGGRGAGEVVAPVADWVCERSGHHARLWHPSLRDLRLSTGETYIVGITVASPGGTAGVILARPELVGGGNELP